MRMILAGLSGLTGVVVGFGCGLDTNDSRDAQLSPGKVCSSCEAPQGGETSDFGGDESPCAVFAQNTVVTLEEATQLGFDTDELSAVASQPIVTSFAWREFTDFIPGDRQWDRGASPTGYQPESSVAISVNLTGTVAHGQYDQERCRLDGFCVDPSSQTTATCVSEDPRGWLLVDAELELKTSDESIQMVVPVVLSSWSHPGLRTSFRVDLAKVSGTLRLAPDKPGPYRGALYGQLYFGSGGARGLLYPEIEPAEPARDDEWWHRPLQGHFPAEDSCGVYELPVDPNTAAGRAIIHQVQELYPPLQRGANAASPVAVQWSGPPRRAELREGPRAALDFELSPVTVARCGAPDGSLSIAAEARVATDDGRLTWTTELFGSVRDQRGSEPAELQLGVSRYVDAEDPFWISNASGIELLGSEAARIFLGISLVSQMERTEPKAVFVVSAVPLCELDPRCEPGEPACRFCDRPLRVFGFDTLQQQPEPPIETPSAP